MKRVLFVLERLKTQNSPNALCVVNIAEYMRRLGVIKIDYLSWEDEVFVDEPQKGRYFLCRQKPQRDIIRKIVKIKKMPLSDILITKELAKKIILLQEQNKYNLIVAVMNPPETAEALYRAKMKNRDINYILYEIDPNSNRYKEPMPILNRYLMWKAIKWEKKVYTKADYIIHMCSHKQHYSALCFKQFENKTIYLDIPGLTMDCYESKNKGIPNTFLYTGAFYPDLRSPNRMIYIMSRYINCYGGLFDIYTKTMHKVIRSLINRYNISEHILLHNAISKEEIGREIRKREILISVGNKNSDFVPSKTLDYIGTNKKIIHFYSDDKDVSIPYLKKYKKCLFIKDSVSPDAAVVLIDKFINDKDYPNWGKNELEQMFQCNTPRYTANSLINVIQKVEENSYD